MADFQELRPREQGSTCNQSPTHGTCPNTREAIQTVAVSHCVAKEVVMHQEGSTTRYNCLRKGLDEGSAPQTLFTQEWVSERLGPGAHLGRPSWDRPALRRTKHAPRCPIPSMPGPRPPCGTMDKGCPGTHGIDLTPQGAQRCRFPLGIRTSALG